MIGPVLLIGPAERDECRAIAERLTPTGQLIAARDPTAAAERLTADAAVELVILVPAHRDQFSHDALQRLFRRQPLAEWWLVVGPWLEGETRSGRPWPGGRRFYLDQALVELRRRMDPAVRADAPSTGWLPPTLSPEEHWLTGQRPWPRVEGCVRICGELAESRRTLMDVFTSLGLTAVAHGPEETLDVSHVDAVVYDAVASREHWPAHIERLTVPRPRSLVVLVNFPRPDEVCGLLAAGATDVLGKPFRVDDLRSAVLQGWG